MLHVADRAVETHADAFAPSPAPETPIRPAAELEAFPSPSRYGAGKSPNWLVIAAILVAHALLIAAILHARHQVQRRAEARLSVVNLTPPPPPPAQEAPPPRPSTPQVVAPPPMVQVPVAPVQQVATIPDPPPPIASAPAASTAPSAAPVAVAAPLGTVQGGDLSAQMLSGKPPRYPVESRRKREQGTVVLSLTLGLDGAVETIAVARSSGFSRLDDAARDAVRRWRWKPMIQQGQPVRVKGVVEIPFVLQINAT